MSDVTVRVFKAGNIGDKYTPSAHIIIEKEISDSMTLELAAHLYKKQARILSDILLQTLPGGVVDALLVELLTHKASMFRVPFVEGSE